MKQNLRYKIRNIRKTLTQTEDDTARLVDLFSQHIPLDPHQIIAAYQKMGSEIDPAPLIKGRQCVFPQINGNEITFAQTPSIIIAPLLAFDRTGARLGQGGGYYDRYFAHSNALRIGLAFAEQEVPHIPTEPHDQKLHWIITPNEAIKAS